MVASALRYRSQAPLIDSLMKEIGLSCADLAGLAGGLTGRLVNGEDKAPAGDTNAAAE